VRYRDYLDLHALKQYASAMNSRAAAAGTLGRLDGVMLRSVILDSGGQCAWCSASLLDAEFEIDHILSLMRGGLNRVDNLATTCPDCNRRKAGKHPATYAQEIVARGAALSPLIQRVLEQYGIEGAAQQQRLFEPENSQSFSTPIEIETVNEDEDEALPPYHW
jgi:hypothetical protein